VTARDEGFWGREHDPLTFEHMFDALRPRVHRGFRTISEEEAPGKEAPGNEAAPEDDGPISVVANGADPTLAALRLFVEEHLPWVSQLDGAPVQMTVVGAGYLERPYREFPAGTPYATIGVATWEAAAAVREALWPIARLSRAAWRVGWRTDSGTFRSIRVYPRID